MGWVLTTSLSRLRADLNEAFPGRDHESDGTIGDTAHQASTSGHNPDDTAGSKSEYSDADSKAEVRAFDADNDLRDPRGIDFQQVIDRILATPSDRDRLAYVIHRRKIWRKKNGWRQEVYTGASPHDEHAHFSGDPASDENGAPWTSVLSFQEDAMLTDEQWQTLQRVNLTLGWLIQGAEKTGDQPGLAKGQTFDVVPNRQLKLLVAAAAADEARDKAVLAAVQALATAGGVDAAPILDAIASARAETHDLVLQLQRQLADVQARNLRLAQALAAAGGALDDVDEPTS